MTQQYTLEDVANYASSPDEVVGHFRMPAKTNNSLGIDSSETEPIKTNPLEVINTDNLITISLTIDKDNSIFAGDFEKALNTCINDAFTDGKNIVVEYLGVTESNPIPHYIKSIVANNNFLVPVTRIVAKKEDDKKVISTITQNNNTPEQSYEHSRIQISSSPEFTKKLWDIELFRLAAFFLTDRVEEVEIITSVSKLRNLHLAMNNLNVIQDRQILELPYRVEYKIIKEEA